MQIPFAPLPEGFLLQNRYRIQELIGQGGMGAVYKVKDERLSSTVALKQNFYGGDETLRRAFEREAKLLANLNHQALPRVIDYFTETFGQFLVMDFITGSDLHSLIAQRNEPFPVKDVLDWADQLLDALDYLHSQQPPILHRDIKPQNVKLATSGKIMLLDFGLAKGKTSGLTHLTAGSRALGYTPNYAPIEQMNARGTDARSDLYSLAATLYHLLTNQTPADAMLRSGEVSIGEADPLQPPSEFNPKVPAALSKLLMKTMAQRRDDRPDSAATLRQELKKINLYGDGIRLHEPATIIAHSHSAPPEAFEPENPPTVAPPVEPIRPLATPGADTSSDSTPVAEGGATGKPEPARQSTHPPQQAFETPPTRAAKPAMTEAEKRPGGYQTKRSDLKIGSITSDLPAPRRRIWMWMITLIIGIIGFVLSLGVYIFQTIKPPLGYGADPGFDPTNVSSVEIALPAARYPQDAQREAVYRQILTRIRTIPGVQASGAISTHPFSSDHRLRDLVVEGSSSNSGTDLKVSYNAVTDDYIETLRIPLLQGRSFNERDTNQSPMVAIISEELARRIFPGTDPIGKNISFSYGGANTKPMTIVGVVKEVKQSLAETQPVPEVYVPYSQNPALAMTLFFRATRDPMGLMSALENEVQAVDRDITPEKYQSLERLVTDQTPLLPPFRPGFLLVCAALTAVLGGVSGYLIFSRRISTSSV
jgi:serine/threonine protein kinase